MKILEIEIDRFGIWNNVTLPFSENGMTVLYGPNEAGKSTLMRFVRGVLYGYQASDQSQNHRNRQFVACSGALRVSHRGQTYRIERRSEENSSGRSPGRLLVDGKQIAQQDPLMTELTGGASESLFREIFAIGLHELQQLATLSGEDIAERIYGMSLGSEGERLVAVQKQTNSHIRAIVDQDHRRGDLFRLIHQLTEIDREINRSGEPVERHRRLQGRIVKQETRVDELKLRQKQLQEDLRGFQFLNRIWQPWKKECDLRARLDAISEKQVDPHLLQEFEGLGNEIQELERSREQQLAKLRQLQEKTRAIQIDPALEQEACQIQRLHEEGPAMRDIEMKLDSEQQGAESLDREIAQLMVNVNGEWNCKRVRAADISPTRIKLLTDAAHSERNARRQRWRLANRYKKLNAELKRVSQLENRCAGVREESEFERLVQDTRDSIRELEELQALRFRKDQLEKISQLTDDSQSAERVPQAFPSFFWVVLIFFAIAGGILFVCGTFAALHGTVVGGFHAAIIGACYALLGLASLGTSWTMKTHFSQVRFRGEESPLNSDRFESELAELNAKIQRILSKRILLRPKAAGHDLDFQSIEQSTIEQRLAELRDEESELEEAKTHFRRMRALRRKLSRLRAGIQDAQKVVSKKGRHWQTTLREFGFSDALSPNEAMAACEALFAAKSLVEEQSQHDTSLAIDKAKLADFQARVGRLAEKLIDDETVAGDETVEIVDDFSLASKWYRELKLLSERRQERTELRKQTKSVQSEIDTLHASLNELAQRRLALMEQLEIDDDSELAQRLECLEERDRIQRELDEVEETIANLVTTEPDLVIVEEQLLEYDEETVRDQMAAISRELLEIDESLQSEYVSIGKVKQELRELENDRTIALLRFDRAQIVDSLRKSSETLLALHATDRAISTLRDRIEKERQPQTLREASKLLDQLTCSKYRKIWTPLEERKLFVDDDAGNSLRVEHLSSGTREQVFLALRLAMIRGFAEEGIELPMVLDDVTVNFDQIRTEAAIETLLNVTESGQQIVLFTCHLHLARQFEQHDVEPIWLPSNRSEVSV